MGKVIDEQQRALGLGKVAYEEFVSQRIAASNGSLYMPPWDGAPGFSGMPGTPGLPDSEKQIWAAVALAVTRYNPFVITGEVVNAWSHAYGQKGMLPECLRAAAEAAGFRVEER